MSRIEVIGDATLYLVRDSVPWFYREIAKLRRAVDDLELLCRPCNAIHYLELKHGPLPFRVVWSAPDAN